MGITIHYKGKAKDAKSAAAALRALEAMAKTKRWVFQSSSTKKNAARVLIHPKCDPVHIEFNAKLRIDDFVKTQFAPLGVHLVVLKLLDDIRPHFTSLAIEDESGYLESRNRADLKKQRDAFTRALKKILKDHPNAQGPVMLPSGRWIDVIE